MQMSPETLQLISHPPPLLGGGGQVLINPYLQHLCLVSIIDGSRFGNQGKQIQQSIFSKDFQDSEAGLSILEVHT
jgi:hypothetical protein